MSAILVTIFSILIWFEPAGLSLGLAWSFLVAWLYLSLLSQTLNRYGLVIFGLSLLMDVISLNLLGSSALILALLGIFISLGQLQLGKQMYWSAGLLAGLTLIIRQSLLGNTWHWESVLVCVILTLVWLRILMSLRPGEPIQIKN